METQMILAIHQLYKKKQCPDFHNAHFYPKLNGKLVQNVTIFILKETGT